MSLSEKWQQLLNSASLGINRATQLNGEIFGSMPKTVHDKEIVKALTHADLIHKICKDLKLQLESMFTPNPVRRVSKIFTSEFNLNVPGDQPPSEKLATLINECAVELPGTDFSVTLTEFAPALLDIGRSEQELQIKIKGELLSIINDFLTAYWPDLQKERQKLNLLRIDYDFARNEKRNKDATKISKAKEDFERQIYVTQVLLKQCEVTKDKLTVGLLEMAKAQDRHYKRCKDIVERLTAEVNQGDFAN